MKDAAISSTHALARTNTAHILDRLSDVELLRALPPDEVQALAPKVELVEVPAGQIVFSQGDRGDALYVIEAGEAQVQRDGRMDVATLGPGEVFGEMAILAEEPRSATVLARTPLTLWRLWRADVHDLVQASPQFAAALRELAEKRRAGVPIQPVGRRVWLTAALRTWGARNLGISGLRAAEERLAAAIQRKRATRDVNRLHEESLTVGQRLADRIAATMGSWPFIIAQSCLLALWVTINVTEFIFHSWDPYPFILMNLLLSLQAAYAAPVIMMSQNRQAAKDRLQAELDLRTNLHAETLIEELHGAMEDLRLRQWQELLEMQERQISYLEALVPGDLARKTRDDGAIPGGTGG
ncbi:MAG TPA: DUF1003 domain-containing protein [Chloroflexota bacterium]|nr:DUF1003 domain-containing protein [Chloroflexota bacterium]